MNDGNSGKFGGSGSWGISGILKSTLMLSPNLGGSGRFGSLGSSIDSGTKLKRGSTISNPRLRWERST